MRTRILIAPRESFACPTNSGFIIYWLPFDRAPGKRRFAQSSRQRYRMARVPLKWFWSTLLPQIPLTVQIAYGGRWLARKGELGFVQSRSHPGMKACAWKLRSVRSDRPRGSAEVRVQ